MKSKIYLITDTDGGSHEVVSNNQGSAVDIFLRHHPTKRVKRIALSQSVDLSLLAIHNKQRYSSLLR